MILFIYYLLFLLFVHNFTHFLFKYVANSYYSHRWQFIGKKSLAVNESQIISKFFRKKIFMLRKAAYFVRTGQLIKMKLSAELDC